MTTRSLNWSTVNETNVLADNFPNLQLNADAVRRGAVKVEAQSPSGMVQTMAVVETNGVYTANFTPNEVGDWNISILYDAQHIQGSPFSVRVYDAAQVRVFGLEGGAVGQSFSFSVDTSSAGEGDLEVNISSRGRPIPAQVIPEGRGLYKVTFTPDGAGIYTIKVYFAGAEVNGSPYTLEIVDSGTVTASGTGLTSVEVNRRSTFEVHTGQRGSTGDIRVNITSPRGNQIPCEITGTGDGSFLVEYTANEIGEYIIDVYYYGKPIQGSPFRVHAYDGNRINVRNLSNSGLVGQACEFDIDALNAGSGNLEIMVNDGTIPCSVQNRGNRQFHASFTPKSAITHLVQMRFNNNEVPGSPWRVEVKSMANISVAGPGLGLVPVHRSAHCDIIAKDGDAGGAITAIVTSPSDRTVSSRLVNNHNGIYSLEYTPTEVGSYTIEVFYNGVPFSGNPYHGKAYDTGAIVVSQIASGVIGRPSEFTIDVTQAGEGQLEIMVNRGSVPNTVKMLSKGVFLVTFVPQDSQPHRVDIKFNGESLPRCPIMVPILDASRVVAQGDGLRHVAVNKSSQFKVTTNAVNDQDLTVRVTAPNGELVNAKIVQQPDGDYKVEYSSKYTGRHTVEILYAGQAIMGSPFYVEIYDPNKIRIEGSRSGMVGQTMEFDIIRNEAGKAELGLTITSPSGRTINYDLSHIPLGDHVTYTPSEPGPHDINVTYGGLVVPGCPITQNILDSGGNLSVYGDGLSKGEVGKQASFYVDSKGGKGNLYVQVDGPNSMARCTVEPDGAGRYLVHYMPMEVGIFKVSLKWNNREMPGSPHSPKIFDTKNIRCIGGWESVLDSNHQLSLTANQVKRIEFDTRYAGPGFLTADARGPNGTIPTYLERRDNGYVLTFTPGMEGDHYLSLFWSETPLPNSPMYGYARSARVAMHEKVVLTGRGLKEAKVREEAEFVIDGTGAGPGEPRIKMTGVKAEISVECRQVAPSKYRCIYRPQLPGAYLLDIMWADRQVKGSPFKVNITSSSDASKVVTFAEAFTKAVSVGREIKTTIDTRRAGPGELVVHCNGPSKPAACDLYDHKDGTFTLTVRPLEVGNHLLHIKFGAEPVPGSPFTIRITGAPDASKVRVSGPGVEHGILATYESRFACDTKGAGAGQLTVRVRGPKGAFRVEMQRESQRERMIHCRYDPTDVGDYNIVVKWSGEHVPGSPFKVRIFDTRSELERCLTAESRRMNGYNNGWAED